MKIVRRVRRKLGWAVRDRFPDRAVTREIQGVTMTLPWSHRLPDYTADGSLYGQNLVELARLVAPADGPLVTIDVGANIGDSTLQILDAVPEGRVVCVEADDYYLGYLRTNVGSDERCEIVPALLTPDASAATDVSPVRSGGTTRFVADEGSHRAAVTPAQLHAEHPVTDDVRLVKSDTDGYDVVLIPALAREYADRKPVLFFEYDPHLSRIAGNDPLAVWDELAALGYDQAAVWENGGTPIGRMGFEAISEATAILDHPAARQRGDYWDVAVVHADDAEGRAAVEKLVPRPRRG